MAVGLTIPFGCGVTLPTARDGGRGKDGMNFAQARGLTRAEGVVLGGHRTLPSPAPIPTGGRGEHRHFGLHPASASCYQVAPLGWI